MSQHEQDDWFEAHDRVYFDPDLLAGTIPIGHFGCAVWARLVVSGPHAGEVWIDDRSSDGGIRPADPARFDGWYLSWLGDVEALTR
jgi:hypothetical protein